MIGGGIEKNVPIIADFMPARWGYEGLIVDTYTNNEYGKRFYEIERKESVCDYKQSYYIPLLKEKLADIRIVLANNEQSIKLKEYEFNPEEYLAVLKNEISKENVFNPIVQFSAPKNINLAHFNNALLESLEVYLDELNSFYSLSSMGLVMRKQVLTAEIKNNNPALFSILKANYYNSNLNEILTNSLVKKKIIVTKENQVMQIVDPIYLNPLKSFINIRTHFYAPNKYFFNTLISTFWFNIIIIWAYVLILFVILYYNVLKKILSFFNK